MSAFAFGAAPASMASTAVSAQQEPGKTTKFFDDRPAGNRYEELKVLREQERLDAIRRGIIDDPDNKRALAEAKVFVGTCEDMCPAFEREQREYQNDVGRLEISPVTGRIDSQYAVKAFHRSAAGNEQSLPSDIRPPAILLKTMDYLVEKVLCGPEPLADTHGFVRDRTRSIRTDLTVQNFRGDEAILLTERIARFHVLSAHLMCETEGFSQQQEAEQLRKSLQSLSEYYDDRRLKGLPNPNEPEFRAYNILTRLHDPDVLRQAQALSRNVRQSPPVLEALELYNLSQRGNEEVGRFKPPNNEGSLNLFRRFFKEVASQRTSYLMACLCETHFSIVRKGALKALRKSYRAQHRNLPLSDVVAALMYDDEEQAAFECRHYGISIHADASGSALAELTTRSNFDESGVAVDQRSSTMLVESKRQGRSLRDVIYADANRSLTSMPPPALVPARKRSLAMSQPLEPLLPRTQTQAPQATLPPPVTSAVSFTQAASTMNKDSMSSLPSRDAFRQSAAKSVPSVNSSDVEDLSQQRFIAAQRAEQDLRARHAAQLIAVREQAEIRHREELLTAMARDVAQKMLRAEVDAQIRESYAVFTDTRRLKRMAFTRFGLACDEIRRRAMDQETKLAEEAEMEVVYDTVLRDLTAIHNGPPVRHRKRRRTTVNDNSEKDRVIATSAQRDIFWKPIDMHSVLQTAMIAAGTTAVVYIDVRRADRAIVEWYCSKFGILDGVSAEIEHADSRVRFELLTAEATPKIHATPQTVVAALIYHEPFVEKSALPGAAVQFLETLQQLGGVAKNKFPVLVTSFSQLSGQELGDALAFDQILADRKSPVAHCEAAVLKSANDAGLFEHAVARLAAHISTQVSPLERERQDESARQARLAVELPRVSNATLQSPLKNSFYDARVIAGETPTTIIGRGRDPVSLAVVDTTTYATPLRGHGGAAHVGRLGLSSAQDFAFRTPRLASGWLKTPRRASLTSQTCEPSQLGHHTEEQSAQLRSLLETIAQAERLLGDDTLMT